MLRIYLSDKIIDLSNNNIYNIEQNNKINNKINNKVILKFKLEKTIKYKHQQYKNINREIVDNNILTYIENYEYYKNIDNYIILKYHKKIVDNKDFPLLYNYDIDEDNIINLYKYQDIKLIINKNIYYYELNEKDLNLFVKLFIY